MCIRDSYYNFGALSNLKQDWSVNLCRQSHTPYAYSSAAPLGAFHDPGVFCKLTGLRGPFDRYHIAVESDFLRPEPTDFAPGATLCVPVVNVGDRSRTVDIDRFVAGEQRATQSQTVTLRPGATFELTTDSLDLEPILAGRNDVYLVGSKPKTDRVVVRDSADRTILSQHFVREPHYLEVMDLEVTDPWQKTLVAGHTGQVSLVVTTGFDADVLGESSLHVALLDRGSLPGVPKTALPLVERTIEVGLPEGSVFYSIDGSDPSEDGALDYTRPFALDETMAVKARTREDDEWSALSEALFIVEGSFPLRITELMYHPRPAEEENEHDPGDFEFIELWNSSTAALDLTGARIEGGIRFDFSAGGATNLQPGERLVIVENLEAFASRYNLDLVFVAGEFTGRLENAGEELILEGALGEPIHQFTYSDSWYADTVSYTHLTLPTSDLV